MNEQIDTSQTKQLIEGEEYSLLFDSKTLQQYQQQEQ